MCKFLKVSRSLVYYHINRVSAASNRSENMILEDHIKEIFRRSRNNYGSRKIKVELAKLGYQVSRRRISRIMKENSLVSNYTVAQYKLHPQTCNQSSTPNLVDRKFDNRVKLEVAVSDLTYVRVANSWNYICTLIDLFNREIIGYSVGANKDAKLIEQALLTCKYSLKDIDIFHSDRGNEYDNELIDNVLKSFKIQRSLSSKGNPYDNAVSEATNKILKTEFIYQKNFESLDQLKLELAEYIYWYNNLRIHGSIGYMSPVEYRLLKTNKINKAS